MWTSGVHVGAGEETEARPEGDPCVPPDLTVGHCPHHPQRWRGRVHPSHPLPDLGS